MFLILYMHFFIADQAGYWIKFPQEPIKFDGLLISVDIIWKTSFHI